MITQDVFTRGKILIETILQKNKKNIFVKTICDSGNTDVISEL